MKSAALVLAQLAVAACYAPSLVAPRSVAHARPRISVPVRLAAEEQPQQQRRPPPQQRSTGSADDDDDGVPSPTSTTQRQVSVRKPIDVSAAALAACEWDDWGEREQWALEDSVPRYSLDGGHIVLFRRMSLEVPELFQFSPEQLHARWLAQGGAAAAAALRDFEPPPRLEDWVSSGTNRYEGALHNLPSMRDGTLRATVEHDAEAELLAVSEGGDAASGCSPESLDGQRRYVRTRQGALFELGAPRSAEDEATGASSGAGVGGGGADGTLLDGGAIAAATAGDAEAVGEMAIDAARAVGSKVLPLALSSGGLVVAAAAAWFFLGHHHVDVSVFIV